jgi:hypothetical protein
MRTKKQSRPYTVILIYANGVTRTVKISASSREVAERRALKHNPAAVGIKPAV